MGAIVPLVNAHQSHLDVDILGAVLSSIARTTIRTYLSDYRDFARFANTPTPAAALNDFIAGGSARAHRLALAYRVHLSERGLSAGTIAHRLAALRAAAKCAKILGLASWDLDIPLPRVESYRDTRGPGRAGWRALLAAAKRDATPQGARNLAILRLLFELLLRRFEVTGLHISDIERDPPAIWIKGKGRAQRERLTLPPATWSAVNAWLRLHPRPDPDAPLFPRLDRAGGGSDPRPLSGEAIRQLVAAAAKRAGLARPLRPHGLRHGGITELLDLGADVRAVARAARHRNVATTIRYDDNRQDLAGDAFSRLAAASEDQ